MADGRQGGCECGGMAESDDAVDLFISAIAVMELELGVLSIERKGATQGAMLRAWLEQHVFPEFSERTLPIDIAVAQRCARLHVPDKRGERDALIAATALVHGMAVVTRNVSDYEPTRVPVVSAWEPLPFAYELMRKVNWKLSAMKRSDG